MGTAFRKLWPETNVCDRVLDIRHSSNRVCDGEQYNDVPTLSIFLRGLLRVSLANSGGVIADIWDPVGRGTAMSIFSATVWIGPATGPIIGGFLAMTVGWRWIFWVMMCFAGVCALLTLVFPETYTPVLLMRRAKHLRRKDPEGNKNVYAPLERDDKRDFKTLVGKTLVRP